MESTLSYSSSSSLCFIIKKTNICSFVYYFVYENKQPKMCSCVYVHLWSQHFLTAVHSFAHEDKQTNMCSCIYAHLQNWYFYKRSPSFSFAFFDKMFLIQLNQSSQQQTNFDIFTKRHILHAMWEVYLVATL